MNVWKSFLIALSMYSRIPVPRAEWTPEHMRWSMCFFPLIGAVCGCLMILWSCLCAFLSIGSVLFASGACLIPLLITGGIHMDGFCDTVDALASHRGREEKLAILKDPHTGAFAVIGCVAYFLFSLGLWTELDKKIRALLALALGFVISRSLSGISVVNFQCAKKGGTLFAFSEASCKKWTFFWLCSWMLLCALVLAFLAPAEGAAVFLAGGLTFLCYRRMSYREFGGITGDLAGWFLETCELVMLIFVVALQKLLEAGL